MRADAAARPSPLTFPRFFGMIKKNQDIFLIFSNKTALSHCSYNGRIMNEKLERKIAALKGGDRSAFDYIYEHTHRAVYFAVFSIVRDRMHAEDILQETYLRALSSLEQYRAGTNFPAWLRSVGRSLALNHLKKHAREVATDFEEDAWKYGTQETELPYIFDVARRLLSGEEYEILMLCRLSGYKRREVAAMLALPVGTVTWKYNEALKKLKAYLIKEGGK